jgi:hypothetical protein
MHKSLLSLVAIVFVSAIAVASESASSGAPPVADGAVPSAYAWLSGGSFALVSRFTSSRTKCLSQKERLSLLRPPR